jgi:hypothetical protein
MSNDRQEASGPGATPSTAPNSTSKTPPPVPNPILTPTSTPSDTPQRTPNNPASALQLEEIMENSKMDSARDEQKVNDVDLQLTEPSSSSLTDTAAATPTAETGTSKKPKSKCKRVHKHKKGKKAGKKASKVEESDSSSDDSSDSSSDSSSSSEDTEEEDKKKRRKKAKRKAAAKKKSKKSKKARYESTDSDSDSESSDSSSSEDESRRKRRKRKARKARVEESEDSADDEGEEEVPDEDEVEADAGLGALAGNDQIAALLQAIALGRTGARRTAGLSATANQATLNALKKRARRAEKQVKDKKKRPKKGSTVDFKRVNHVWDTTVHNWKIVENEEEELDEFDEYAFIVRRKFDWDNHYTKTVVDVKSKLLKQALMEVMKDVQGETLEADEPSVDPNMLFLYLEDIRTYYKKTLKARLKKEKKRKGKKRVKCMISHCRVLCRYLDDDYEDTKKTLYPLLKAGNITFDLLWALFKPNTIAYTSTYNDHDNPRCFKVDRATKEQSFIKGEWYCIEGRYLEYDGKNYGLGDFEANVESFKGSRKITSLATYPLQYHKDPETIKKQLIERGKQFVSMTGMNYRFHKGMAFQKKRKAVAKFNINGRVMIDPATFRRINPNYAISLIKPKEDDDDDESESEEDCGCGNSDDEGDENSPLQIGQEEKEETVPKTKFKVVFDKKKKPMVIEVPLDEDGKEIQRPEKLEAIASDPEKGRVFTEEELLIASPVVLGFAFSEKAWLEFSLSGIREIDWNERAYESLVLPKNQKHVVKALVSSHKFHAAETIDDVVQGKGRGLVFVLHGPPGGKSILPVVVINFKY